MRHRGSCRWVHTPAAADSSPGSSAHTRAGAGNSPDKPVRADSASGLVLQMRQLRKCRHQVDKILRHCRPVASCWRGCNLVLRKGLVRNTALADMAAAGTVIDMAIGTAGMVAGMATNTQAAQTAALTKTESRAWGKTAAEKAASTAGAAASIRGAAEAEAAVVAQAQQAGRNYTVANSRKACGSHAGVRDDSSHCCIYYSGSRRRFCSRSGEKISLTWCRIILSSLLGAVLRQTTHCPVPLYSTPQNLCPPLRWGVAKATLVGVALNGQHGVISM